MFTLEQYRELMQTVIDQQRIKEPENSFQEGFNYGLAVAMEKLALSAFLTDED